MPTNDIHKEAGEFTLIDVTLRVFCRTDMTDDEAEEVRELLVESLTVDINDALEKIESTTNFRTAHDL